MAKYRNKTLVDAFKFDGDLINSKGKYYVPGWAVKAFKEGKLFFGPETHELCIINKEGIFDVGVGDIIIKDYQGELHTCTAEVFKATYEIAPQKEQQRLDECVKLFNSLNVYSKLMFFRVLKGEQTENEEQK